MRRDRRGFTLLEIMIVVAVIAAIAIPSLIKSRSAANETKAISALKAIGTAQATYRIKSEAYASTLEARGDRGCHTREIIECGPSAWWLRH